MKSRRSLGLGIVLASITALITAALTTPAQAAVGPISTLYALNYQELSGNTVTGLDLIQGVTETSLPTSYALGINIAVYGDVRTMGYSNPDKGEKFDLAGNIVPGGPYINNIVGSQLHDGTSDGSYNYTVNYTTGDVLRFDRNWASPSVLFNVTAPIPAAGYITMNASDGSFWISQWGGGDLVGHFSPAGTLLSSFNSGVLGSFGLAMDPADGTLWMGDYLSTLHQFNQSGAQLQSVTYAVPGFWYGMEFDNTPVPEPSSLVLTALAILGMAGRVWARQRDR